MEEQRETCDDVLALAASWYEGKTFSTDWTSEHFQLWATLLKRYRDIAVRVIEVGSLEGRSALFFLNYLRQAHLVCIDVFDVGDDSPPVLASWGIDLRNFDPDVESRFDANVASFRERVQKIRAPSNLALAELGIEARRFDIAYIDGSHLSVDVYSDAVLMWPMMATAGIIIFDDYEWPNEKPGARPKLGIDCFLRAFEGQYRVLHRAYQVAIEKL